MFKKLRVLSGVALLTVSLAAVAVPEDPAPAAVPEDVQVALLKLVEEGACLEDAVYKLILEEGVETATAVVLAAYQILPQVADLQEQRGCAGDIGEKAIAAGADPNEVLAATAAGLGGDGGPSADLGSVGGSILDGGVVSESQ